MLPGTKQRTKSKINGKDDPYLNKQPTWTKTLYYFTCCPV